jgi:hypothetical protein
MADNVTPADVAANIQPPTPFTPVMPVDMPDQTTDLTKSGDYKKYKDIYNVYNPVQQLQNQQVNQVNDRYATNTADMKNLFGTLTTLRQADQVKITEQYAATIAAQQAMLSGRTEEAKQIQQQMMQNAAQAGSELGGPANAGTGATNPVNEIISRGVGQSNALATIWQNMMASQNMNNQASIQKQIAGYGGQEVQGISNLDRQRESSLLTLQGKQTDIDTNIAQSKKSFNDAEKARKEQAKQDALNRANQYAIAKLRTDNQNTTYSNDAVGWTKKAFDAGFTETEVTALSNGADAAYNATKPTTTSVYGGGTSTKPPTKAAVLSTWKKQNKGYNARQLAMVTDYLDLIL